MEQTTQEVTFNHSPVVIEMLNLFKGNKQVVQEVNNNVLVMPSRLASKDHGLPLDEVLNVVLSYSPKHDGWDVFAQVKIRKIVDDEPKFSEKVCDTLLEGVKKIMEAEFPTVDEDGKIPFQWIIDLDDDAILNDCRIGSLSGVFMLKSDVEDLFDLLMSFADFPEVVVQDVADMSPAEIEELKKKAISTEKIKLS